MGGIGSAGINDGYCGACAKSGDIEIEKAEIVADPIAGLGCAGRLAQRNLAIAQRNVRAAIGQREAGGVNGKSQAGIRDNGRTVPVQRSIGGNFAGDQGSAAY